MARPRKIRLLVGDAASGLALAGCGENPLPEEAGYGPNPTLPPPKSSWLPTINVAKAVGWKEGEKPTPLVGGKVSAFARGLQHPRWLYELPNGDILVAENDARPKPEDKKGGVRAWVKGLLMERAGSQTPSANRISLLRDTDGDGVAETKSIYLENLTSPFGWRWSETSSSSPMPMPWCGCPTLPARPRMARSPSRSRTCRRAATTTGPRALSPAPMVPGSMAASAQIPMSSRTAWRRRSAAPRFWRSIRRAAPLSYSRVGLRNPVGIDWNPMTKELWVAVNERDEIGDDLVPDYMTSVKRVGFYGWPYSYYGQTVDTRVDPPRPDLVAKAVKPDYALGSHTASLGFTSVSAIISVTLASVLLGREFCHRVVHHLVVRISAEELLTLFPASTGHVTR